MNAKKLVCQPTTEVISLPAEIFERWVATGPGWQGRMTQLLSGI